MKKKTRLIALLTALVMLMVVMSGCASNTKPTGANNTYEKATVRLAVHSNEGSALTAIGLEKGIFEKYGIDVKLEIVESGPPEMAAMRADNRTLDIGYIGPGVSWNAIDSTGNQLSYVFFDFLGNSERLLARDGVFTDANNDGTYDLEELYQGLKGQKIYLEVGTTPGIWLMNFINTINDGRPDEEKLWMQCDVESYLAEYVAPNTDEANKLTVVNYNNANIPAGMSTSSADRVDIAVAFSPATTAAVSSNSDVSIVADSTILPASKATTGVWVASNDWIEENPEVAQRVINALYESAVYRTEHLDEAIAAGEKLCQKPDGSFSADVVRSISAAEYKDWFEKEDGIGWTYMRALYDSKVGSVPEGSTPKTFEESVNFTFFLNAIANIAG